MVQEKSKGNSYMEFQDKTLKCKDCGNDFIFSAGEQAFYQEKGFENEPVRCRDCRDKRRRQRDGVAQETQVPFQPKDDRPVYCRDCFSNHRR